MKERPILFSAPMVRAILEGRKTQTRRVAPISNLDIRQHDAGMLTWSVHFSKPIKGTLSSHSGGKFSEDQSRRIIASQFCPYGKLGDRLWVREAWSFRQGGPIYDAAGDVMDSMDDELRYRADRQNDRFTKWKPSIHMPRWASRITLEITGVRVERLQYISEDDCLAEGVAQVVREKLPRIQQCGEYDAIDVDPVAEYRALWESINGPGTWDANPWVWVVEFQRVDQKGGV